VTTTLGISTDSHDEAEVDSRDEAESEGALSNWRLQGSVSFPSKDVLISVPNPFMPMAGTSSLKSAESSSLKYVSAN